MGIKLLPILKSDTNIRGIIALVFIGIFAFFIISSLILGGLSLFFDLKGKIGDVKEFIMTMSGIFSGPLGLVIGYYFRSEIERTSSSEGK